MHFFCLGVYNVQKHLFFVGPFLKGDLKKHTHTHAAPYYPAPESPYVGACSAEKKQAGVRDRLKETGCGV